MKQCSLWKNDDFFDKKEDKKLSIFKKNFNHPFTSNIKNKVIEFAPFNIETMTNSQFQTIRKDFYEESNLRLRVSSAKYIER